MLAELGADAGEEHRQLEGLGDVVVGAGVEPVDLVAVGGVAGEHQDRALDALLAQQAAELAAVHVGQADVEDDEVVVLLAGAGEAALAVAGLEDVELLGQHELVRQRLAQVGVVVHEEDLSSPPPCLALLFVIELLVSYGQRNISGRRLTAVCPAAANVSRCAGARAGRLRRGGTCAWAWP